MKKDIRLLVQLNVVGLGGSSAESRESKDFDREGLENGLSLISLVIEEGERKLTAFWCMYESKDTKVKISYPRNFDLRTEEDRRRESEKLLDLSKKIQSDTFQREMFKRVVDTLMGTRVTTKLLEKMKKEIDDAPSLTSDPATILADLEAGLVSSETASEARGYSKEEAAKAQKEKAERMALIAQSQGGEVGASRGTPDFQTDKKPTSADEKTDKSKRGEGKIDA